MKFLVNALCSVVVLQMCSDAKTDSNHDGLIIAYVVHRHADRNIQGPTFPKNPYKSERQWKGGFGRLTRTGKLQGFELGTFLRSRYKNLIGNSYSSGKVYYRSTDRSRTVITAQCCLTGLFKKHQVRNNDIKCDNFNIRKEPVRDDYLLHPSAKCKRYEKLKNNYFKSREVKGMLRRYHSLIRDLEKNTGKKISGLRDINHIHDTLYVEDLKGLRLPNELQKLYDSQRENLEYLSAAYFSAQTHNREMKKFGAGYLLKDMLVHFKDRAASHSKSKRRLYLYSSHDHKLVQILDTLGVFDVSLFISL